MNGRPITGEVRGTPKPAKSFAGAADPYTVTLSATSTLASPLECAHTKNASANPLECAFTKSLDLKSPEINTYKKGGGSPLLAFYKFLFANRCSSVVTPSVFAEASGERSRIQHCCCCGRPLGSERPEGSAALDTGGPRGRGHCVQILLPGVSRGFPGPARFPDTGARGGAQLLQRAGPEARQVPIEYRFLRGRLLD